MAGFQIKSMSDKGSLEEVPRNGRVNEMCREWLMHEDQALAHRLQNEEYQSHLGHNKNRNALLRRDTPHALAEQIREDERAALAQTAHEIALAEQARQDSEIAARLSYQLELQDRERRRLQEDQDKELALRLMESEKGVVRQKKEVRQVEREAAYLGINSGSDNVALLSRKDRRDQRSDLNETTTSNTSDASKVSSDLSDLSDFCLKPSDGMDEDETRRLQEEQDAELSILLQEQDLKRRGDLLHQDQLMAIEAQDRELAKVLQEQERAKVKKAREKARQKALAKKQLQSMAVQEHMNDIVTVEKGSSISSSNSGSRIATGYSHLLSVPHTSTRDADGAYSPVSSPRYASPDDLGLVEGAVGGAVGGSASPPQYQLERPRTLDLPRAAQSPTYISDRSHVAQRHVLGHNNRQIYTDDSSDEELEDSPPFESLIRPPSREHRGAAGFTNIACAIDPTYQRRVMRGELPSPPRTTSGGNSTTILTQENSSIGRHGTGSPISPLPTPVLEDDDDYPVPPYMPIQGQRRTASLEKVLKTPRRGKEKSAAKESCKQQ